MEENKVKLISTFLEDKYRTLSTKQFILKYQFLMLYFILNRWKRKTEDQVTYKLQNCNNLSRSLFLYQAEEYQCSKYERTQIVLTLQKAPDTSVGSEIVEPRCEELSRHIALTSEITVNLPHWQPPYLFLSHSISFLNPSGTCQVIVLNHLCKAPRKIRKTVAMVMWEEWHWHCHNVSVLIVLDRPRVTILPPSFT